MSVTDVFRQFGPVWVKIRRDSKMMPFAFAQYTKLEHAERAIREGKGRLINGRPCRTEKAKAHRKLFCPTLEARITANCQGLFLLERRYGTLTLAEARRVLTQYGCLEACYHATSLEQNTLQLPADGIVAQFELYENGQSAQAVSF